MTIEGGQNPSTLGGSITKQDMIRWIKNSELEEDTTKELLKEVARYPGNTMNHFFNNIYKHVARIHACRKKS